MVINDFHFLTFETQYALIKIMEDNYKTTRFIIVTKNYNKCINSIKSRCVVIFTDNKQEENKETNSDKEEVINFQNLLDFENNMELYNKIKKHIENNINIELFFESALEYCFSQTCWSVEKKYTITRSITNSYKNVIKHGSILINIISVCLFLKN